MDLGFGIRIGRKALPPRPPVGLTVTAEAQATLASGLDFTDTGAIKLFEDHFSTYATIYRKQPAVRSVVDFLAKNIAQIGLKVFEHDGNASIALPNHPVQRLLNRPSRRLPRSRFFRQVMGDLAVYDRALILKVREQDLMSLVRVPIPDVSIETTTFIGPETFLIGTGRNQIRARPDDVIWLHGYSPTSNASGTSPMETLRQILAEETAAGIDRERAWKNGNRADGYYKRSVDTTEVVPPDAVKRWETMMKERTSGYTGAHGSPLLPPGFEYQQASFSPESSEYLGTRRLAREEVARAYNIPLPVLGLMDTSNWGTDQYHQMLYQDCLAPWLVWIQEEFEQQLLYADFELQGEDSGVFLEFNIAEKMKGSFLEQAKIGQQAVGGPWMTRNEFREKFQNLPPVEGGDEIVVPSNVVLAGGPQANPQDASNQFTDGLRAVE